MVGSREEIVAGGQRIRARKYPWGVVEGKVCACVRAYVCTCMHVCLCVRVLVYMMCDILFYSL